MERAVATPTGTLLPGAARPAPVVRCETQRRHAASINLDLTKLKAKFAAGLTEEEPAASLRVSPSGGSRECRALEFRVKAVEAAKSLEAQS